jgi:16S rRNA (cytosine967-C5)-methyltransferase
VFPQENHRIIHRFLKQQAQAKLININADWGKDMTTGRQLLPDPNSHDGFFYAVLEKTEL